MISTSIRGAQRAGPCACWGPAGTSEEKRFRHFFGRWKALKKNRKQRAFRPPLALCFFFGDLLVAALIPADTCD